MTSALLPIPFPLLLKSVVCKKGYTSAMGSYTPHVDWRTIAVPQSIASFRNSILSVLQVSL